MLKTVRILIVLGIAVLSALSCTKAEPEQFAEAASPLVARPSPGQLKAMDAEGNTVGLCPLKHTDVQATVTGLLARVTVTQEFHNPFEDKIEAVYTFPLTASAASDDMTMTVGDRVIRGQIKEREEARQIYEEAREAGHVASLLDQERPNIFTQAVANIEPGKAVTITISYTELLDYEDGEVSFVFPMVVGPRYIPGQATGAEGTGWAEDTDQVPDASRITPPVTPEGTRTGHDISLTVHLDAGAPIGLLRSDQHATSATWRNDQRSSAVVQLANQKEIPNRDFVLVWSTATDGINDAVLTGADERGGYFLLMLQPPRRVQPDQIVPREIIFVLDTSGSMGGFPIETSKAIMRRTIAGLRSADRFNLVTFAGATKILWEAPRANTAANRAEATAFVNTLEGGGGTEMMTAIQIALGGEHDPETIRMVAFLTDGYVGND
ncbi:MAG: VIT domain-containing protein, partial [Planctomycetota bacterium]